MALVPFLERAVRIALTSRGVQSRRVVTPAADLHLYDAVGTGTLPPVVCLHGLGSSSAAFATLILRLRLEARRVIAPDMPGHGLSGPPAGPFSPDVISDAWSSMLVKELGGPALLVGNSLGGAMALRFALDHPEKVLGIVLSSPAGAQINEEEFQTLVGSFLLKSRSEARAFFKRIYHRPPWFGPLLASDVVRSFARPYMRELIASFQPAQQFTPEELSRLTMPILLLWGRSDRLLPRAAFEFYQRHLPGHAIVEELEATGHSPHVERPVEIVAKIVEFERSIVAGTAFPS